MAKRKSSILNDLSTADLKRLLSARERIDVLEKDKTRLLKELAAVEKELVQLMGGKAAPKTARKKAGRKKAAKKTAKKTVRKKAAVKKTGRKKAAKKAAAGKGSTGKTTKKKAGRKKTAKKAGGRKAPARRTGKKKTGRRAAGKAAGAGRVTLEDVIVQVIRGNKGPIGFKDLMKAIVDGKLFKTRSSNFDNVLRRTLSTSAAVKRVGRGVYDVA